MKRWQNLINSPGVITADGAMGTMLQQAGLTPGDPPMLWNVDQPGRVRAVHRAYLEAGARILLTNTFNGTRFRLAAHKLEERADELNRAGAQILRAEIDDYLAAVPGTPAPVAAGDIGPTGEIMAPLGRILFNDAVDAFARQARALLEGGADVIWIETMADLEEVRAAVEGTRKASLDIPIIVTMTFDTHGRTMMGVKPEAAATRLSELGAAAMGGNCGNGPDEMLAAIEKMHSCPARCWWPSRTPACPSSWTAKRCTAPRRKRWQTAPFRCATPAHALSADAAAPRRSISPPWRGR